MQSPYAARIRAARGYADLSQKELASRLGFEEQWVKRREGDYIGRPADRQLIADACEVPVEFLENGWSFEPQPFHAEADLATRRLVRQLTDQIVGRIDRADEDLARRLDAIDDRLRELEPSETAQAQAMLDEIKKLAASALADSPAPGSQDADASVDAGNAKQGSSEPGSRGKRRTPRESAG